MKKLTVTVGIPAYNEEENIGLLLDSLLKQTQKTIDIKKIIVISDGSIDKTVSVVKRYDKKVKCIAGRKRLGQPSRLNQLFSLCKTDVLVYLDADTICKNNFTIENLVSKFKLNKTVGLVAGKRWPLPARTFIESAVNNYIFARNSIEKYYNLGKTSLPIHGFLAFSKIFLKKFKIPKGIINNDVYSYFWCIKSNFKYIYAKNALIYYRTAGSVADYIRQMIRYIIGRQQLNYYFERSIIMTSETLPKSLSLRIMLFQLKRNPLAYIFLKLLTLTCLLYSKLNPRIPKVTWSEIESSKKLSFIN